MTAKPIVFFIDVDNTLLDNDHIKEEIKKALTGVLGEKEASHFWHHHDEFREYKKLVDFPNIIHEYCAEKHKETCDITLERIFASIEFSHALYPQAREVLNHLKTLGKVILFTEGDSVYQKRKVQESGLGEIADEVLLFEHKWEHVSQVVKQYDRSTIVLIDDRAEPLVKIKHQFPHIFTIEVCQGHYARVDHREHQALDKKVHSIGVLLSLTGKELLKK